MKPIVNINFKEDINLSQAEAIFEHLSECLNDADCYLIATFEPVYEIKELNENQKILKFEGKFYTAKELEEILRKVAELNDSQPSYLDKLREAFPLISEDHTPSFCPSEIGFEEIDCEGKDIPKDCYSCWRSRIPKKEE